MENIKHRTQRSLGSEDPVFDLIGIGKGDGSPVAREHDKYLYGKKK